MDKYNRLRTKHEMPKVAYESEPAEATRDRLEQLGIGGHASHPFAKDRYAAKQKLDKFERGARAPCDVAAATRQ